MMDRDIPERIVCAANRAYGVIVMGLRHNDSFMRDAISHFLLPYTADAREQMLWQFMRPTSQGFLTNRGRWVDRQEAYEIASKQLQLVRKTGGVDSKTLFSEDVY